MKRFSFGITIGNESAMCSAWVTSSLPVVAADEQIDANEHMLPIKEFAFHVAKGVLA